MSIKQSKSQKRSHSAMSKKIGLVNPPADEETCSFGFGLHELAHDHLGLSQNITAPSQVWRKIEPSFAKLSEREILESYKFRKATVRGHGRIGESYIPKHLLPLPPLPSDVVERETLKKQLLSWAHTRIRSTR